MADRAHQLFEFITVLGGVALTLPLVRFKYPYVSIWSRQYYGRNESSVSRRTTDAYHSRQRSVDAMALLEWLIVSAAAFGGLVALMYVAQRSGATG
jgi:hypothetical protein